MIQLPAFNNKILKIFLVLGLGILFTSGCKKCSETIQDIGVLHLTNNDKENLIYKKGQVIRFQKNSSDTIELLASDYELTTGSILSSNQEECTKGRMGFENQQINFNDTGLTETIIFNIKCLYKKSFNSQTRLNNGDTLSEISFTYMESSSGIAYMDPDVLNDTALVDNYIQLGKVYNNVYITGTRGLTDFYYNKTEGIIRFKFGNDVFLRID